MTDTDLVARYPLTTLGILRASYRAQAPHPWPPTSTLEWRHGKWYRWTKDAAGVWSLGEPLSPQPPPPAL